MKNLSTATDADIRAMIADKFGGPGGGSKLARAVGVSQSTACVLRQGGGALDKAAAYFCYVRLPEKPGSWRRPAAFVEPAQVGYRLWTDAVKEMIRQQLTAGRPVVSLAKDFNVSPPRLRAVIKRFRLREISTEDAAAGRRVWAEIEARKRGGSLGQQVAYMEHLLRTPAQRADIAQAVSEMTP